MKLSTYEPGNGASYVLGLEQIEVENGDWPVNLFIWENAISIGRCVRIQPDGYIAPHYLNRLLGGNVSEADLRALLSWLGTQGYDV